ncbi:hypothetical protein AC578_6642 [Pseudocercospora eumusae]|uniref:Centrosomin N-terminal motif 1 domain-containing protein n=1 Tax=Pseudocercospora eumusae TaxID=321146 RepID=A0A139HFX7_9PEZI|nr:hypothetical protein AC578_6642 [Pseudocercospora eumusae]
MSTYKDHLERSPLGERGHTVLPTSQLLQERLQERRARNIRPKRARHTDIGLRRGRDDDIFLDEAEASRHTRMADSSPLVASMRASDASGQSSDRRRRAPGVRDMDDQFDRLNKANFALKLELDHRREQTTKLQQQLDSMKEQIERAVVLEEEHKELLRINSELVQELEKRDKAVEEAMDIICDLEEQVNDMEERNSHTRPSTANADSGYAGTETHDLDLPSSPPAISLANKNSEAGPKPPTKQAAAAASEKLQGLENGQTPAKPRREPMILSSKKPSTNALRTVYMENARSLHPVKSFHSLLSRQEARTEEDGEDVPNSPRLSVLSESSFPSIYSPKDVISPDRYAWEGEDDDVRTASIGSQSHIRQDSIKRVSRWIEERDEAESTPSKVNHLRHEDQQIHYQSLNDALSAATQGALGAAVELKQQPQLRRQPRSKQQRPTSIAGPIFGDLLPPTPDSASTRMLRESRSSIVEEKSLLDSTPAVVEGFNALEVGDRTAPRQMRSSVELKTAYASNLHYRSANVDGSQDNDSSDEEYTRHDADTGTIKDFGLDYDGYPDGKSLLMGTPSRFQQHGQPPADLMFNMNERSPTQRLATRARHRSSSEEPVSSPSKPRLSRVETSPTIFGSISKIVGSGGRSSAETVTSPRSAQSQHSGSSGNRTVMQADDQSSRALSPEGPRTASRLSSSSPAKTLSKKIPNLLRRLSGSQGSDKPPLPTLTSTPSSAYVNNATARPKTSHTDRASTRSSIMSGSSCPPSSQDKHRPSAVVRTKTEPATERPASAAGMATEKRTFFTKRSSSVKNQPAGTPEASNRGAPPKRRGSLRDAVATRRPWRQ